ncbi:MAG: hypothetical protein IPG66_01185 [Hydrogenophilales bacterium]|nr:hypothetical protein [Hydrogenophilales bacterium]
MCTSEQTAAPEAVKIATRTTWIVVSIHATRGAIAPFANIKRYFFH